MPDLIVGSVVWWQRVSPILARFRLMPEAGSRFPDYQPGQYIALRREKCRLTKKHVAPDGRVQYDANVNVYASNRVTDRRGSDGYVIHVRPEDLERAARTLEV